MPNNSLRVKKRLLTDVRFWGLYHNLETSGNMTQISRFKIQILCNLSSAVGDRCSLNRQKFKYLKKNSSFTNYFCKDKSSVILYSKRSCGSREAPDLVYKLYKGKDFYLIFVNWNIKILAKKYTKNLSLVRNRNFAKYLICQN